jgi:bifunctional DNA-binding transcriptional regulator/antitoxin component of YhaV-PrlF toxin-antitoxin module
MQKQRLSLKLDERGRVTIPFRIRQYFELPDLKENDIWLEVTIHGPDEDKHPELTGGDA